MPGQGERKQDRDDHRTKYIQRLLESAPPLSPRQVEIIRALMAGVS